MHTALRILDDVSDRLAYLVLVGIMLWLTVHMPFCREVIRITTEIANGTLSPPV